MEKEITSPFAPKKSKKEVSEEELREIKKILGVKCIFLVADTEKHDCTPETCTGHYYTTCVDGFSPEQVAGIIMSLAEKISSDIMF